MDIVAEILARVNAARDRDPTTTIKDFQIRVANNGYVLINQKTGLAHFIYDEDSKLSDLQQLFPNVTFDAFSDPDHRRQV